MDYIEGSSRDQLLLFPQSLDEYISEDNPARFIDAFAENLDMKALGFKHAVPKETGRPPYRPNVLLKLYNYGYLNRIRSSRRLEREAHRNVEVIWLTGKLMPDHPSQDLRQDHRQLPQGQSQSHLGGLPRLYTLLQGVGSLRW